MLRLVFGLGIVVLVGCEKEEMRPPLAPAAPPSNRAIFPTPGGTGGTRRDGGMGGADGGGVASWCHPVGADDGLAASLFDGRPLPFTARATFAYVSECVSGRDQLLVLGITDQEDCNEALEEQTLAIFMDVSAVRTGALAPRGHLVGFGDPEVDIVFVRRGADPEALWGLCSESANATVDFELVGAEAGNRNTVAFNAELTDCATDPAALSVAIDARIDEVLIEGAEPCP